MVILGAGFTDCRLRIEMWWVLDFDPPMGSPAHLQLLKCIRELNAVVAKHDKYVVSYKEHLTCPLVTP